MKVDIEYPDPQPEHAVIKVAGATGVVITLDDRTGYEDFARDMAVSGLGYSGPVDEVRAAMRLVKLGQS